VRGKNIDGYRTTFILDETVERTVTATMKRLWRKLLGIFDIGEKVQGTSIALEVAGTQSGARAYIREIELAAVSADDAYDV
jgi:hypothetical protein